MLELATDNWQLATTPWLYHHGGKRAWDVGGAALGLMLVALPLALCMVLIRWESPGPALLAQARVGRHGKPFRLWKLRTMRCDAEADGQPRFAGEGDDRVTRIGAWLRAWHGDELPQLWNVLRGEMSLVGPRPERPCFVARFRREIAGYDRRHLLRPGLTGWAQVNIGYAASLESTRAKTRYDWVYLAQAGWALDWRIWCRTWGVARGSLRSRGSRRLSGGQNRRERPRNSVGRSAPGKRSGAAPARRSTGLGPQGPQAGASISGTRGIAALGFAPVIRPRAAGASAGLAPRAKAAAQGEL